MIHLFLPFCRSKYNILLHLYIDIQVNYSNNVILYSIHRINIYIYTPTNRYTTTIYKCKKICEEGAQQLLLDTQSLKQIFTQLRSFTHADDDDDDGNNNHTVIISNSKRMDAYTKVVVREIGKAEAILKLVQTPSFRLIESLPVIWPAATESDFIDLMNLKGIKKNEQDNFLEQYKNSPDYKPDANVNGEDGGGKNNNNGSMKNVKNNRNNRTGSKKKKDFWSFVTDTKKNMETHVDKAKKAALTAMNK